ncbi:hypothetical protein F5Y19DRAFT_425430 [Xylariaceae sp. FL1651]|nr:hypothetical protein F5Y19DRAFT_425430 [Xylariaceae sp. FL1651]
MTDRQSADVPEKKTPGWDVTMNEMWIEAAKEFENICGESLQQGDVKNLDDVQRIIEHGSKALYGNDVEQEDKWDKAKSIGLRSLKYLKTLVGVASQASSLLPFPASAANLAGNALCFVFDIPEAIKGYNDAVDQVFTEVSPALSQFQIFKSMDNIDSRLINQIHLVMISFVKICAHVVKYRQGRKRDRILRQFKSIFDDDSGLANERTEFRRVLQQQRDIEGTVTLAVVCETRQDIIIVRKTAEETQKGVQSLSADADRIKNLNKIRDTLSVPLTVRLDTRTTQTCTDIWRACLDGTGSWLWAHGAYLDWTAPKDKDTSHVLLLSGPPSSGKTSASSLITKCLEEQKGRTYVAHYFFPASIKRSDDEKYSVQSALKYMAFQIARVDATVAKALGKACEAAPTALRSSSSLDNLWGELKIGLPGSGATYYLVFDGLENLPAEQAEILLKFAFGSKLAEESAGRVRVLLSGTDDQFANEPTARSALRIQMEEYNEADMRKIIINELDRQGILKNAKPNSNQQKARDKIIEKLPRNVKGSYSMLQFGLNEVIRLLNTRTAIAELDRMLDQSMSSHEVAIKNLQRSLTADEISELNELLKWVLFTKNTITLEELEAVMFLHSATESLTSLQYIIKNKYPAVLRTDENYVYVQDGVKDYLQKEKDKFSMSSQSKERATISMTINVDKVDHELCAHFFWDLAHKAIRDKFKFDFDAASSALHNSKVTIAVGEFEAHHTIVMRAFEYLSKEHCEQTKDIGVYLVRWLPYHLECLRQLEDQEKGELAPDERLEIGQKLYEMFKDEMLFRRHRASFEQTFWTGEEMETVWKWLMDSAVVRRLNKKWRDEVQSAIGLTRGYLKELVKVVIEGFLRERSWEVENAYNWIREFMSVGQDKKLQAPTTPNTEADANLSGVLINNDSDIDWDRVSTWCQGFLGLPDSEINSLWYERLAEAASSQGCKADIIISLYQRALDKEHASWLCHRGLGETHFGQSRTLEAIVQVELALKGAEQEDATPEPKEEDRVELQLLLGDYNYLAGNMQKAAEHYLFACESGHTEQARRGHLGHLKSRFEFSDAEEMRKLLKDILACESGEGSMPSILKMLARDVDHDTIVLKIFNVAKEEADLLKEIVHAMETATTTSLPGNDRATEMLTFADQESCGILLYDRGVAAYTYKISPEDTEPISEALRLWKECLNKLSNVGGSNASITREMASTALANYYFQSMVNSKQLDHVDALSKLAEAGGIGGGDAAGFLGALYALRNEKEKSKAVLRGRITLALQILTDDMPENDDVGFFMIFTTLAQHQDFVNMAIAMLLQGQPDLVTEALYFEARDVVDDDGVEYRGMLDVITKLGEETACVAKTAFPNSSQQIQRIKAAKAHIDSLVAATESGSRSDSEDDSEVKASKGDEDDRGMLAAADSMTAKALRLLQSRLSILQQKHTPEINIWTSWCDGYTLKDSRCQNSGDCEREMYHCIYCQNRDFCRDCLKQLRDPESVGKITGCSAEHRWLRIPPQGGDMYAGPRAKSVQVPREVRAVAGDESILEICYTEGGDDEITVEAWKEMLAREWDIPLEEIRKGMGGEAKLEKNEGENIESS